MSTNKHSGLGIASLIISIGIGLLIALVFVIATIIDISTPGGMDTNSVEAAMVGLAFMALMVLLLLPLGLGVAGLFQADRNKTLPVLGVTFSVGIGFISIFLMLIGLIMDL